MTLSRQILNLPWLEAAVIQMSSVAHEMTVDLMERTIIEESVTIIVVRTIVGWIIDVTIADCRELIVEIAMTMVPEMIDLEILVVQVMITDGMVTMVIDSNLVL